MSASWIHKLNESDSRLHKEDVIRQALEAAILGSTNAINFLNYTKACYNPWVVFGVKQIPETVGIVNAENPWDEFAELLVNLVQRNITGNAARDAIDSLSVRFDSDEWNTFCRAILRRDLRAGVSDKTINKVCKGTVYEVHVFGCQLATNSENRPEMKGIKRLEPKLDGVRMLMMVTIDENGSYASCYSRNGKVFENFTTIESQVLAHADKFASLGGVASLKGGFILDGEVVGESFQELMRQARRKKDANADDSVFRVFDIIPLADFNRGYWNAQLYKRISLLENSRSAFDKMPNVEPLTSIEVDLDTSEGRNQLDRYAKDMVNLGYEGIMIKDLDSPYECKRNTFWMKWKPTLSVDLTVIGVEEGTGRNVGRMGALVCEGMDDNKLINVNAGSGYSDEERQEYWDHSNEVIGRTAEILCDAITQNRDGTYSLRFPRFVRFRDDK